MNQVDGDKVLSDLAGVIKVLKDFSCQDEYTQHEVRRLVSVVQSSAKMIKSVRAPVSINPTDDELIKLLSRAEKECDSALLHVVALRLRMMSDV